MTVGYNGGDRLPRAVASMLASEGVSVRALVVDNASSDGSADVAAALGATVVRLNRNLGYGAALNHGLATARTEWVVCANQDIEVSADAVDALIAAAEEYEARVGVPCVTAPMLLTKEGTIAETWHQFPTPVQQGLAFLLGEHVIRIRNLPGRSNMPQRCDWVSAVFLLGRAETFRAVGGFDPKYFMYVEDVDFFDRLRSVGCHCVWVPEAKVTHLGARGPLSAPLYAHVLWNWKRYFASRSGSIAANLVLGSAIIGSVGRGFLWWARAQRKAHNAQGFAEMFFGASVIAFRGMVFRRPPPCSPGPEIPTRSPPAPAQLYGPGDIPMK